MQLIMGRGIFLMFGNVCPLQSVSFSFPCAPLGMFSRVLSDFRMFSGNQGLVVIPYCSGNEFLTQVLQSFNSMKNNYLSCDLTLDQVLGYDNIK